MVRWKLVTDVHGPLRFAGDARNTHIVDRAPSCQCVGWQGPRVVGGEFNVDVVADHHRVDVEFASVYVARDKCR